MFKHALRTHIPLPREAPALQQLYLMLSRFVSEPSAPEKCVWSRVKSGITFTFLLFHPGHFLSTGYFFNHQLVYARTDLLYIFAS
jgi:hypothetical protein